MDNIRVFLWVGFGLLVWTVYQTWQQDYGPAQQSSAPVEQSAETDTQPPPADLPDLPPVPGQAEPAETSAETSDAAPIAENMIRVYTDVLELQINPIGGDIQAVKLPTYPVNKNQPDVPVQLLSPLPPNLFVFKTGLRAADGAPEANHRSRFSASQNEYRLADDEDELVVSLHWQDEEGVTVEKIYRFERGSYAIDLEQLVRNDRAEPYRAVAYLQIQQRHNPPERSMFNVDSYSYSGPVVYDGDKYEKLDVEDLPEEPFEQTAVGGWIASIQHHFLAAAVPTADEVANYQATFDGEDYLVSVIDGEFKSIAPGSEERFSAKIFVGPKLQSQLTDTADGLALTVDYGLLTILAQPLFWLLQNVYKFIGNWGWTIVIVTFLIKLVFYKLTETSGRSMAKMRKLQPRLKTLQERYKDDREALSKAMMELYKREKVNPAAGCLPMVIQIPFFIAFYWVLLESVELRQAPFMLWITDLSSRDPFFILPLLMGAAMYFQQKLNPAPPDPVQAKVMQFLPVIFTAMFAFFPAGLVLYWLTNSVLSMLQQWRINKVLGAE